MTNLTINPLRRDLFYTDFFNSDDPSDSPGIGKPVEAQGKFFTRLCKVLKKPATFENGVATSDPELAIEPVEYIEIRTARYKDVYIAKATEKDKIRFSTAYKAFLNARKQEEDERQDIEPIKQEEATQTKKFKEK